MCVVSMVTDHYRDKWPSPIEWPTTTNSPNIVIISKEQWEEYLELKRKAEEYDKRTNQPHCEKEGVEEWEKRIEDYLKKKGIL